MIEWDEYKLGDIISVKHGFAFKGEFFSLTPTNDILLTPGNFDMTGGFKSDKFKYYTGKYPKEYILAGGDIIITMTDLSKDGDTLGYSAKIPKHEGIKYLHNQRLGLIELKNPNFSKDFLHWLLRTKEYQQFIVSSATGTTVRHTSPTRIYDFKFKAPVLAIQTGIATILSSLDDKIELNNVINKNLEDLAKALFKHWFLDFEFPNEISQPYKSSGGEMMDSELGDLPVGWRLDFLENILDLIIDYRGKTPLKLGHEWSMDGITALSAKNVKNRRIDNLQNVNLGSEELYKAWMKDKLQYGDILLTSEAPLGETALLLDRHRFILSQRLFALRPKSSVGSYYIFEWLSSNAGQNELEKRASGSTVTGIRQSELRNIKLVVPSEEVIANFNSAVKDLYKKIEQNDIENNNLISLRNILLPKLMSGELTLQEAEELTQTPELA